MSTIRQSASFKKMLTHVLFAAGIVGTFVLMELFVHEKGDMNVFYIIPFSIGGLAILIAQFIIKCQACGGNLAPTIMNTGHPFAVSKKINFCPCCGISIDTEISQLLKKHQANNTTTKF
jgi:hypothetical protein